VPQLPQLLTSVLVLISQPSAGRLLQSAYPALQLPISHVPAVQLSLALGRLQTVPQPPQWFGLVLVLISQPSAGELLQSAYPELQLEIWHEPPEQLAEAFARLHTVPQPPQLLTSVLVLISQPSAVTALQSAYPALQLEISQVPVAQLSLALGRLQAVPQSPQLVRVSRGVSQPSSGSPSQSPQRGSQTGVHTPAVQVLLPWELVHWFEHAPQLFGFVLRLTSQPSAGRPLQSAHPASQLPTRQVPVAQVSFEDPGRSHVTPQAPQLANVSSGVSQPLSGSPSQSPQRGSQLGTQVAARH
jgi:hypothetical protein